MMMAALFGVLAWINVAVSGNNPDAPDIPFYCAVVGIWSTLMLEFWKRKQNDAMMRWGMTDFEEQEKERHDFEGDEITSPVDGGRMRYAPTYDFVLRVIMTSLVTAGLIGVVLITLIGLIFLKIVLRNASALYFGGVELGGIIVPFLQTTIMLAYDYGYTLVSLQLNHFENHRTDTQYEDSLILKTVAFRFINNYAVLFYIAFVKPQFVDFDPCTSGSCFKELQVTLGTIFASKLLFNLAYNVLYPIFLEYNLTKENYDGVLPEVLKERLSLIERTFMKTDYDEVGGTLEDYAVSVILLGFTTMFIAAFPLATAMSLVSVFIEIRLAAWKLAYVYRRPLPRGAADIGTWYHILEVVTTVAVLTNAGMVAFTGSYTQIYAPAVRTWIFVGMSAGILLLKYVVAIIIPDMPLSVEIQLARKAFFHSKIKFNRGKTPKDDVTADEGVNIDEDEESGPIDIIAPTDPDP